MPFVFHYTDTNGLIGILNSGCLFATHYRYLNDSSECSVVRENILRVLQAELSSITPRLITEGFLKEKYYAELGKKADEIEAEGIYNCLVRAVDNISPFFVLSLCTHKEGTEEYSHGLLSQWRGYANGGGVAIEFDELQLDRLCALELEKFRYAGFKSDAVEYKYIDKLFQADDYKGMAGEMVRRVFADQGVDVSHITGARNVGEAVKKFAETAPFLKHLGFCEEAEYRIVMLCPAKPKSMTDVRQSKAVHFRVKDSLIVPYIKLFEDLNERLPIRSVILGPHALQERQEEAVKMLLDSRGFEVPVRRSGIPFQG